MVPLCMGMGCVWPKYGPVMIVCDCEYMDPINLMASLGNPKSTIIARSLAWSMEPKTLVKSINKRYISWFVKRASSSAAIKVWIWRLVQCS
jgi:hypothetical protein